MMSNELGQFYVAYSAWIDDLAPVENEHDFRRFAGLCGNLIDCDSHCELLQQFSFEGLDKTYPFNDGAKMYGDEVFYDTCHLNPKRIAWVRTKAAEFLAQGN